MATGDSLLHYQASMINQPTWMWVAYTSGSVEPTVGDVIWGDTSNANAYLEYYIQLTGTWAGGDSAGWMFLSNWSEASWTSSENFTRNTTTAANNGTFTSVPVYCYATIDDINNIPVLDFDDTVNEVCVVTGVIPSQYSGGGLTVTIAQSSSSASLDMSWGGMIRSFTDDVDNLLHTSFNAWGTRNNNTAIDAPSVVGELTYDVITFASGANMDNLVAGEFFQLLLFRDAQDSVNDDLVGDTSLVHVQISET